MILADTSVWVDHLRLSDKALTRLLDAGGILMHPFEIGELALGNLGPGDPVLDALQLLPQAPTATEHEVLYFIQRQRLYGLGIGYVDAHLLAAVRLTTGASLWTRDRRLLGAATRLGLAAKNP